MVKKDMSETEKKNKEREKKKAKKTITERD